MHFSRGFLGRLAPTDDCIETRKNKPATRAFSFSSKRDFYNVLSVGKTADKGEIKKAYFKLAKLYHPDMNSVRYDSSFLNDTLYRGI